MTTTADRYEAERAEHDELIRRVDALGDFQRHRLLYFLCGYADARGLARGLELVAPEVEADDPLIGGER